MYIIYNKKTDHVIHDDPMDIDPKLKAKDIYPDFDSEIMEMYQADLPPEQVFIHYDNLLGQFNVGKDGFLAAKSIEEKAEAGDIRFDPEILKGYVDEEETLTSAIFPMRIVELGIRLGLIKTAAECGSAFKILDHDQENRLSEKYSPGLEIKLLKDYVAWIDEGKPKNDKRGKKYLEMSSHINALKKEYKSLRDRLKKIKVGLKAMKAEDLKKGT